MSLNFSVIFSGITTVLVASSKAIPVYLGDRVTLTCAENNLTTNASYSWSLNGTTLTGKTMPTLVIPGVLLKDVGQYQCTVINNCGSGSATLLLETKGEM